MPERLDVPLAHQRRDLAQGRVMLAEYDVSWPATFEREAERIRARLGASVLSLEHVGSTAVPGLVAKPVIDMQLTVASSAHERDYAPALESLGYTLVVREPEWFEHRMFAQLEPKANLHVFSQGCSEPERVRLFRDWLRASPADAELYATAKRQLAAAEWEGVQSYAEAKTDVVGQIMARAERWALQAAAARSAIEGTGPAA